MAESEGQTQDLLSDLQKSMSEGNIQDALETIRHLNDNISSTTTSSTSISTILRRDHSYLYTYTCEVCQGFNCERCEENGICDIHDCSKINVLDGKLNEEFAEKKPKIKKLRASLENSLQEFESHKRALENKFDELQTKINNFHLNFLRVSFYYFDPHKILRTYFES